MCYLVFFTVSYHSAWKSGSFGGMGGDLYLQALQCPWRAGVPHLILIMVYREAFTERRLPRASQQVRLGWEKRLQ